MKNRTLKEYLAGRKNSSGDSNENLHFVSDNRQCALLDVPGKQSHQPGKVAKNGVDDLLAPTDAEKQECDTLFASPQAPVGTQFRSLLASRKTTLKARSASTTRTASKTESNSFSRLTRSSSATRPSISASRNSTSSTGRSSSYSCPSSPRKSYASTSFHSTLLTPSRVRSTLTTFSIVKTRSPQQARSSATRRGSQISENSTAAFVRSSSRPPTPSRTPLVPSVSVTSGGRKSVSAPRLRTTKQASATVSSESPPQTPTNLKAMSRGRAVSAGRSAGTVNSQKGNTSPVVTRGRVVEASGRTVNVSCSTGLGKTMSRTSLAKAIKRMNIGNGKGSTPNTAIYPHSIRSSTSTGRNGSESSNSSKQLEDEGGSPGKDTYESGRYDALFLTEDVTSTNWLLSIDDPSDPALIFQPVPEPFGPL